MANKCKSCGSSTDNPKYCKTCVNRYNFSNEDAKPEEVKEIVNDLESSDGTQKALTIFIIGSFIIWCVFMVAINEADSISELLGSLLVAFVVWALLIWSISVKSNK